MMPQFSYPLGHKFAPACEENEANWAGGLFQQLLDLLPSLNFELYSVFWMAIHYKFERGGLSNSIVRLNFFNLRPVLVHF